VTSLAEVDPQTQFDAMRAAGGGRAAPELVGADFKEVKLRLADGKEVPARFVLKDGDLDLAFMAPDVAADAPKPETRVVVLGDSDFAATAGLGIQGNRDLFMNIVGWLSQQENLISIRPHDAEDRRITLTADQERRIFFLTVLIVPGLILLAGVQTWWRRR